MRMTNLQGQLEQMSVNQQGLIKRTEAIPEIDLRVEVATAMIADLQEQIVETQAEVARMAKQLDELHTDFDAITADE